MCSFLPQYLVNTNQIHRDGISYDNMQYKFINDDGDNNTLSLKDFTAKDLEYKTPQLGNAEGKGEYIIDLVYDQESEGSTSQSRRRDWTGQGPHGRICQ